MLFSNIVCKYCGSHAYGLCQIQAFVFEKASEILFAFLL